MFGLGDRDSGFMLLRLDSSFCCEHQPLHMRRNVCAFQVPVHPTQARSRHCSHVCNTASRTTFTYNHTKYAQLTFTTDKPALRQCTQMINQAPVSTDVDVVVVGAGPAGLALSSALGKAGLSVLCVDPNLHRPWPNNFGMWHDELERLGLTHCASQIWNTTSVYTDSTKTVLPRAYVRIDNAKLKRTLLHQCEQSGLVSFVEGIAADVDERKSTASFVRIDSDGVSTRTRARVVVDCTGPALKFTRLQDGDNAIPPSYQAAYGIEAELEDDLTAYADDEMLLMDYRDDHMQTTKGMKESRNAPAFLYVMPMSSRRAFFEETSLIADEAVSFESLERRLYLRLAHHGVRVRKVLAVERSLIPMGGALPVRSRTLAFGASAGFVHPATGYSVAHTLARATPTALALSRALAANPSNADLVAQRMWNVIWSVSGQRHRGFLQFGADVLRGLNLVATRQFFLAFFRIPTETWAAFLDGHLDTPTERLLFALGVFWYADNSIRLTLIRSAFGPGGASFFTSVLPLPIPVTQEEDVQYSTSSNKVQPGDVIPTLKPDTSRFGKQLT